MADPQEPPEKRPDAAPEPPAQPAPPAKKAIAKKTPAKKTPAKKAPAKKAVAKKAPAKKAPAKKAPAPEAVPPQAPPPAEPVVVGAKEAAAQAKSTVEKASDSVAAPVVVPVERGRSPLPIAVAALVSLLAVLVVRQLRRNTPGRS
jgi:hypothetical protein